MALFVYAGGGTGGHVIPLLAVAEELRRRGHDALFFGTSQGIEARLVPARGFALERVEIGGLMGLGLARRSRTLAQLPASVGKVWRRLRALRPAAVFSLGGYVAGPTVLAALFGGVPVVAMEPNAMPGVTNRRLGRWMEKTLITFPDTARYFPQGRTEVTGLPVREEFFRVPAREPGRPLRVLVTGGSRGSRTLNRAARDSWSLLDKAEVRMVIQTGRDEWEPMQRAFAASGLEGEVTAFVDDMPAAFAGADLIVARSGAGSVAELAAAGKPSVLVPFPFAADDHQRKNAEVFERAGAAVLAPDAEMTGARLAGLIRQLGGDAGRLRRMGEAARGLARAGAAGRAADLLEAIARRR